MRIRVNASRKYDVIVGKNILGDCGQKIVRAMPCEKYMIVTDSGVPEKYVEKVLVSLADTGADVRRFVFPQGEKNKNMRTLEKILSFLAENSFTRSDGIVAVGGGVVGDISGLAAALYMRGIKYAQVPTTLLAAIDSSVGGKTAVDTPAGKNLVGAFNQPAVVVCDVDTFSTLSKENVLSGMGEGVKYGVLEGGELWETVRSSEYDLEKKCLISRINGKFCDFNHEKFVSLCVAAKARVVEKDEKESDIRKILNLGHSVGHAIEKLSGYRLPHGICVAKGLVKIAEAFPDLTDREIADELKRIFANLKIDCSCRYPAEKIVSAMRADKKSTGDEISAVVIGGIGCPIIKNVSFSEMQTRLSGLILVKNAPLFGEVNAVPGKSHAHRMLICSALADAPTEIDGIADSDDVKATIGCLKALGASAIRKGGKYIVNPVNLTKSAYFDCRESGSTLRFLLPVAAALGVEAEFRGKGNLPFRPIEELSEQMQAHGVGIERRGENNLPLKLSGRMRGGKFVIDGGVSSQYITGLLLAAPLTGEDVDIRIKGELKSREYVDITISVMERFGVSVEKNERG
ncbi:MAG: 3-dehydroquinate synthase, partial [Clostridia bacterium]|nr:3-dehydroquinate synthase [Clostridia bacterium]